MDNLKKEKDMEMAFGDQQKSTMMSTKEIILKIIKMDKVSIDGQMEQFTMEHLKTISNMEKEQ